MSRATDECKHGAIEAACAECSVKSKFDDFAKLVRESVDKHAKEKNYTKNGLEGENQLVMVGSLLEFEPQHGIGEIVYKCAEYLKNPREVLLIKIAGWAYILWSRGR